MSFCRITGKSRNLPKPNYFPLLPPISPADAKRFCRITGKSYGLPTHHYIPVVLGYHKTERNKRCKITTKSKGLAPHHYTPGLLLAEKKKHVVLKDYRYVFPVLDPAANEQQAYLASLLESKDPPAREDESSRFVYTVEERRCSLVFPARWEAAVRDGDVRDVMLSRDCDSVLLRLKQGKNVTVDFKELEEFDELYDGFGPREDIYKERQKLEAESKKRKKKKQEGLSYAKKIFEDKEKAAEEEELKIAKEVKMRSLRVEKKDRPLNWKQVGIKQAKKGILSHAGRWKEMKKPLDNAVDWSILEAEENSSVVECSPTVKQLPAPILIEPHKSIDLEKTQLGTYNTPISEETAGFEAIAVVDPFVPLTAKPDAAVQEAIRSISSRDLEATQDVCEKFSAAGSEALQALPRIEEIQDLVESMSSVSENFEMHNVRGLKLDIKSAQRFIAGQTVQTPSGSVFVPGQTLQTPKGNTFVPGFTVNTPDGPVLIPGQIISVKEKGNSTPVFVAGQTLPTLKGEEDFVQGQTFHTSEGSKFVPGQTVVTKEGPKFVAGLVADKNKFLPGQVVATPDGAQFIPGQTSTDEFGQQIFIPGQSYQASGNWEFMPGQSLKMEDGAQKFVPGQTIMTTSGLQFVPGQNVIEETGQSQFVPGITVQSEHNLKFVTGMQVETPRGMKFVEGQIVKTLEGEKFLPGTSKADESGIKFAIAKSLNEVNFSDPVPTGIPVDSKTASAMSATHTEIFGHLFQTETGVEFIPKNSKISPRGKKMIPGQLVRENDGHRFVPGIMTEDGFLPGQIVNTENGEQFIPGQVINTASGPKFVPGQMVETRSGVKFVPGQTIETAEGPQFVPGQIVETKVGPTFIPGQVISTEDEGSRFVPGQVVNTPDGPRFVPGRVVESAEHGIIFVPGQIVQTEEGPRFVAPDLIDTPEGELEFSVQGFEVTPEELKLLRPKHLSYDTSARGSSEVSIDADMLKHLSDAGLSLGKRVSTKIPNVSVDVDPRAMDLENGLLIAENLGLQGHAAVKMAQVVSTIAKLAENIVHQQQQNGSKSHFQYQNGHDLSQMNGKITQNGSLVNGNGVSQESQTALKTSLATAVAALIENMVFNCNVFDDFSKNIISEEIFENFVNGTVNKINQAYEDSSLDDIVNGVVNKVNIVNKEVVTNGGVNSNGFQTSEIKDKARRDFVFTTISETLKFVFKKCPFDSVESTVEEFLQMLVVSQKRNEICKSVIEILDPSDNKVEMLKSMFMAHSLKDEVILEKLTQILQEEEDGDDVVSSAFISVSRNDPTIIIRVLEKVSHELAGIETEKEASELVHKAIVEAMQEFSETQLTDILNEESSAVKELLLQAVGLAKALGMYSTAESLLSVIDDEQSYHVLAGDKITMDILKRLTVMRKLAEKRPELVLALKELTCPNEEAKSGPSLRTLVRESAALMVVPEDVILETSNDIPASLLFSENALAMEDFMMRAGRKQSATFMILKHGLQAVVPREAARQVLTGQVAYTLVDERGVQHFEPLHVFSALRLSKPAAHRFSMYCCPVAQVLDDPESDVYSSTVHPSSVTPTSSLDNSVVSECRLRRSDLELSDRTLTYHSPPLSTGQNTPNLLRVRSLSSQDNHNLV